MVENTSFADLSRFVYRGSQGIEIQPGLENQGLLAHENGQKWPITRVLPISLESCTGGHRASKFSRDPKIMGYNPRKLPEITKNTSFVDPSRVVYQVSQGIEILPGPENYGL